MIKKNNRFNIFAFTIFLIIFYFPIFLIIGTTLTKYNVIYEIISRPKLMDALFVSLVTSIITTIFSVTIATLAAVGLSSFSKKTKYLVEKTTNLPLILPDIISAIGLLVIFIGFFGRGNFGWATLILSHLSFGVIYAFLVIYPRAKRISKQYYEVSQDLGANYFQTLFYVILPNLKDVIFGGAVITFIMSFDDYIISKINGGLLQNISIYLFSSKRLINRLPGIYSISTIIIILITFGLILKLFIFDKKDL